MPTTTKSEDDVIPNSNQAWNQLSSQDLGQGEPTLGFNLVAVGLVAYILYTAKLFVFTWLQPIAFLLVLIGFGLLILGAFEKDD